MKKELLSFTHFKDYALFLLENHLDKFVEVDLKRSFEVNLPLLKYFKHLSGPELIALSKEGITKYLTLIIDGKAVDDILLSMERWKKNQLPGIQRDDVVASDISLVYNVRKNTLLQLLPLYTSDLTLGIRIITEIENYYAFQETLAIETFTEINHDKIERSEKRLKEAQSHANLGYWDYDVNTREIKWSDELYAIYGLDKSTPLIGDRIRDMIVGEDGAILVLKVKDVYENGGSFVHEYCIRRPNGEIRTVVDKAYSETTPEGIILVKGITQDITERKNIEKDLKMREEQLQEAQALAHLGSWEWDTVKNIVHWSDEMYRLFGFEPGELVMDYETYLQHIHPDHRELISSSVAACYASGTPYSFESKIIQKDGTIKWLYAKGQVSKRQDGKVLSLGGTAMDITRQKNYQNELKMQSDALAASNKELEAFCYTIAHDLRSPLRAIDGFAGRLAMQYEEELDTEAKRLIQVVRSNARHMAILIDSLLDFSRLNRKELKKSVENMEDIVHQVVEECKDEMPDFHSSIIIHELPPTSVDKNLIHQVWHNLISNAIKFSSKKEKSIVEIGSLKKDAAVIYYVKDNGAGFEMEYSDKLFGVFQRLHSNEEFEGTGVGLATVQRIVERHGGTVWGESVPGQGATFYFTL